MAIYTKNYDYLSDPITVNGKEYVPDFIIAFPVDKDAVNLEKCTCVFTIRNSENLILRDYVGAEYFELLNNENIKKSINGYLPEHVNCFTETFFPLEDFLKEKGFNI
ncbi:hypothetical protein GKZ90_0021180 [Flavobacterium sp. MC2016-06]|jgi:hypothetical protein|uniref:hypothetical protein n=1 Tax=Flavobacterium sp. MC2016-06 TaxID=2676308 RepID=UPI0012BA5716|nr:hypothetical protein [Flavobacterium sp. MC2016-06]MBU3861015.1 hypothetical protein [Flavobacterium sp. MC2016-06]